MNTQLLETQPDTIKKATVTETKKILIIDDHEENCKMMADVLGPQYSCFYSNDSMRAIELIKDMKPDLVLLDYKMPGLLGVDICKMVRENETTKDIPIVFVSGAATIDERITALELGADDFITKPFHVKELLLRVKARLADKASGPAAELSAANLRMNLLSRQVFVDGKEVELTPKQFDILRLLVENKNNLVTRNKCLDTIWGSTEVTSRNVDSQINYLKRKISDFHGKIQPVPSLGYRLEVKE
jgi:two-component system alkaline phosphatase synthesis response regulator PhoP